MTTDFESAARFRLCLLLAIAVLHASISTCSPSLQHDTADGLNDTQHKRNLRVLTPTTKNQPDNSEERGFNVGVPSGAFFNDITASATQKLDELIKSVKVKISSRNQQATDMSFRKYKVDMVEADLLLKSNEFQTWFNSVNKAYRKNTREGHETMVTTLRTHFGDQKLAVLLSQAERVSSTKAIARKLEETQFEKWLSEKKSVENVFKLLKLDQRADDLFKTEQVRVWNRYADQIEKKPDEIMFLTMKKHFDDETLAKMLIAGKDKSDTAGKLERVELEQWLRSGKTSDDIFNFLNLNVDNGNLLKNPAFETWISFVTITEKRSPYDSVFAKLSTKYDEQRLTTLIYTAKNDFKSRLFVDELEAVLQKKWIDEGKSANDVFKLLQLDREGDALFTSPMWSVWASYVRKINAADPERPIYLVLKAQYDENKLGVMISDAVKNIRTKHIGLKLREEAWRSQGKTLDDIFKLLKLDEEGISFVGSPKLSFWISYATKLEKLKENPNEFAVITYLDSRFSEWDLARKISMEKDRNRVTSGAMELQKLRFKYWKERGMNPNSLSGFLLKDNKNEETADMLLALDFYDFYFANGGSPLYKLNGLLGKNF